jgi:AsmA-like C-terminal region
MTKSPGAVMTPRSTSKPPHNTRAWTRKMSLWACGVVLATVASMATGILFINIHWPYRYRNIKPLLEEVLASQVTIGHYHRVYFPNPGFMATEITLRRKTAPDLPPLGSIESVVVEGTWRDLLMMRERVRSVDITKMHIVVPALGSRENHEDFPPGSSASFAGPSAVLEELRIHDSLLDIMRSNGDRFSFPIRMLTVRNLEKGQALAYSVDMQNAKPSGHIFSTGSFGPLNDQNLGATPLSGDFTFAFVNLHDLGDISGTLISKGHFQGKLADIEADATSYTPDFAVGRGKATPFTTAFRCAINGVNGDVTIRGVDAKTAATTIHVEGSIAGSPKTIDVDLAVLGGRAQDVLRPFLKHEVPVAGTVWLHSHAHVDGPGDGKGFLEHLKVDGNFVLPAEKLTNKATEQKLSGFSQRETGVKDSKPDANSSAATAEIGASNSAGDVFSSLNGHAQIRNGVVSTQRITFLIPGAGVDLSGTFNLRDGAVHLEGNLRMQANISHATTGFKSIILKPLIPFFKKKQAGAVVPIAIRGKPGEYRVMQNLLHHK